MNSSDKRLYPRYDNKIAVTIHKDNELIPAMMTDISKSGIAIITGRGFFPGTKIKLSFKYIDDCVIHGIVRWTHTINKDDKVSYRIGIEADSILIEFENDTTESSSRSKFINRLLQDKGEKPER